MNRYRPFKTNTSDISVLLMDTEADTAQIIDNILFRIRAGTGLLQTLTGITMTHMEEADFCRLIVCAYLPLQEGLDMLEQMSLNTPR